MLPQELVETRDIVLCVLSARVVERAKFAEEIQVMATVVHERLDVPLEGFRISWGGVWAGVLTVLGTLLFLATLGLAIGVTAADPGEVDAGALGMGAAIWSALSLLVALFIGGMAAARLGMIFDKAAGAFEGALVWVLSFLVVLWLASSGVRLVASGISNVFGGVTQTISAATGGMNMDDMSSGGVDQILTRLRDPQTARIIASATGMSQQDASARMSSLAQRVEAARNNPEQATAEVRREMEGLMNQARQQLPATAERVQETAAKSAWWTFAAMLISLLAAIGGAMFGRRRAVERLADATREGLATTSRVR
jgi:hypothetical protein